MADSKPSAEDMERNWLYVTLIEERLANAMKSSPTYDEIDGLIRQLRTASENVVFFDFPFAIKKNCERHLWDCHTLVNNRYRKLVEAYKKSEQRKLTVERRKLEKRYADFIKTSQYFYKSFIQRLASQYPGNYGLRRIAHRLQLSTLSVDAGIVLDANMQQKLEHSCYTTLLHLGDLSRYRSALSTKEKESRWGTAVSYYQLAHDLLPELGSAHNQLAVIATYESDHLTAVYHTYRGVTAVEPLKEYENNLEIAFNKVISSSAKNKLGSQSSVQTLINWFTLLHAKFYQGVAFSSQKELENEVLTRLSTHLRDASENLDAILNKFVLINIAAEYFTSKKMSDHTNLKAKETFAFTLEFNIRFMLTLLQTLLPELEGNDSGEDIPNAPTEKSKDVISATCRRILPPLRQYSVWLTTRARILANFAVNGTDAQNEGLRNRIVELWKSHALTLSKLLDFFNKFDLEASPYLLEEDESTVGFKPFHSKAIPRELKIYFDADGNHKPRVTDLGIKRNHPNIEMQSRVRDILIIGSILGENPNYPLSFSPLTQGFIFDEAALMQISVSSPTFSASSSQLGFTPPRPQGIPEVAHPVPNVADGHNASEPIYNANNFETQLSDMVQQLVEGKYQQRDQGSTPSQSVSNESSYGMHSETVNDVFGQRGTNTLCQITPKHLPQIPGFDGTFAPMPNELSPSSRGRLYTPDHASQPNYSTPEGRLAAAKELERITSYSNHPSWQRPAATSRSSNNPKEMPFGPYYDDFDLHDPSNLMSSSNNSSSVEFGTPLHLNHHHHLNQALPGKQNHSFARNDSTFYAGASNFDSETMLRSSPWVDGRPGFGTPYAQTPPAGQGRQID